MIVLVVNWPIHYDSTDLQDSLLWLVIVGSGHMFTLSVHWGKIVTIVMEYSGVCLCQSGKIFVRIESCQPMMDITKLPVRQGDEVRCPKHNASATDCG